METVLITGATSGIGYELAKIFAANKYNLVLIALEKDKLAKCKKEFESFGVKVLAIQKDLSYPKSAQEIYEEVKKEKIIVDILVNNAGFSVFGLFNDISLDTQLEMIRVNNISLINLTGLFVKDMVKRKKGKILNTASIVGFFPGPLMAVYNATKAFILSFSEALANELKDKNITVTALCPGPVNTNFAKRANIHMRIYKTHGMDPKTVAIAGYDALMKGKTIVVPGKLNKFWVFLPRISPRGLAVKIARKLYEA